MGPRWFKPLYSKISFAGFFLILLSIGVYLNTLSSDFVWDDFALIVKNKHIRGLDLKTFFSYFINDKVSHVPGEIYRPLYILSYALNYRFSGLEPFGYHLTNVILHAINTILVFFVTSVILNSLCPMSEVQSPTSKQHRTSDIGHRTQIQFTIHYLPAFITALLFAVHPIHTESVAWVKGRDDPMALLFMLIAFYLYIKGVSNGMGTVPILRLRFATSVNRGSPHTTIRSKKQERPGFWHLASGIHLLSLFFYLCALLSKEMAITLPLILLLYDFTMGDRSAIRSKKQEVRKILPLASYLLPLKRHLPYWLMTFFYFGVRTRVLSGQISQQETYWAGDLVSTIYTMARGVVYYIKVLILPVGLIADHVTFPLSKGMDGEVLFSFFLLLIILTTTIVLYKYSRIVTFSILWFFITLLPVSNFIPIKIAIAERFLYIPSFGFCLLLGVVLKEVWERGKVVWRGLRPITVFILIMVVSLYSYGTFKRNKIWKDGFSLWTDVLKRYPDNVRAHINLGNAYEKRELYKEAANEHLKAIKLNPRSPHAHYALGNVYAKTSNTKDAIKRYKKALLIEPELSEAHYNLGLAYEAIGSYSEAIKEFKDVIRIEPDNTDVYILIGKIYMKTGDYAAAVQNFFYSLELDTKNKKALTLLRESQRLLKKHGDFKRR